jgi:hypothetical protein
VNKYCIYIFMFEIEVWFFQMLTAKLSTFKLVAFNFISNFYIFKCEL